MVAKSVEEAWKLVDAGFEYICDIDDAMIFRKPKWSATGDACSYMVPRE